MILANKYQHESCTDRALSGGLDDLYSATGLIFGILSILVCSLKYDITVFFKKAIHQFLGSTVGKKKHQLIARLQPEFGENSFVQIKNLCSN